MNAADVPVKGVVLAVLASAMFALISPYVKLLSPLDGVDIFAWRVIWTLPFTLALVAAQRGERRLWRLVCHLGDHPWKALTLVACAGLLGLQQWLFLWAPLHGRMLEVSLGYFLLPLSMVLVGRFFDRQHIHPLQWLAVAFALIGVTHEFAYSGAFSWPTLVVALGFPPYFLLRRTLGHDSLSVFAAELIVMFPVAAFLVFGGGEAVTANPRLTWLFLPGLGLMSAVSFAIYLRSSRMLPMALFGLLGYIEPVLLVVISTLAFGENISIQELWTYAPIALSVLATATYVLRGAKTSLAASARLSGRP